MFRMLDLFSGIGGFSLAASWVWKEELEILSFVECDKFCQKVLSKHWPDVPIIQDVREVTLEKIMAHAFINRRGFDGLESGIREEDKAFNREPDGINNVRIDLLTGGFPCQPFSCAGKRQGASDARFLWPEMLRVIQETAPTWIIAENVPGLLSLNGGLEFESVYASLENEGYEVQAFVIPACAVNAPHRRDRVWIVAHDGSQRTERISEEDQNKGARAELRTESGGGSEDVSYPSSVRSGPRGTERQGQQWDTASDGVSWWATEPDVGRVANGVPARVDRIKALGNAIVPQIAQVIGQAIMEYENDRT